MVADSKTDRQTDMVVTVLQAPIAYVRRMACCLSAQRNAMLAWYMLSPCVRSSVRLLQVSSVKTVERIEFV